MNYQIAFAPDLAVDARAFAAAWNASPERHALAAADVVEQPLEGFPLDPELVDRGLVLLSAAAGMAGGLALEALKDAVKAQLTAYLSQKLSGKPQPSIRVASVRQPDGAYLLVVTEEEA